MSPEHRNYVYVRTAIGSAFVNAALNAGLGWIGTRELPELPMWHAPGVAADLLATAFGVAFGTCLGSMVQVRVDLATRKVTLPDLTEDELRWVDRLPANLVWRGIVVGTLGVLVLGFPILTILGALHTLAIPRYPYLTLKTVLSFVEGGVLAPTLVLAAFVQVKAKASAAKVREAPGAPS